MYRSGESEYAINNNQCRMKDIRELLMDTGIGVEGYSLIGQGQIADIISNKSDSIRDIFEETAGIVSYRTKKNDAEKKLSSTSANMERVSDIIGEIEGRIGGLREESEKAAEYLKLRDRYKELEINITLKNIETNEKKNLEYHSDVDSLTRELTEIDRKKEKLDRELSEKKKQSSELDLSCEHARESLMQRIEDINAMTSRSQMNSERLAAIDRDRQRLSEEISVLSEKLEKEKQDSMQQFANKEKADESLSRISTDLTGKTEEYSGHACNSEKRAETIQDLKESLFGLHGDVNSRERQIQSLEELKETLENRRKQVTEEKDGGKDSSDAALLQMKELSRSRETLQAEMDELKDSIGKSKALYGNSIHTEKALSKKLQELKLDIGQLASRRNTIEEMESNYEGYNNGVRSVMKSGIRGIHGVVAELINVPSGYETALETALGGALQNIICDDDASAKESIKKLKAGRSGRATFLPIESVRPGHSSRSRDIESMPGFIGFGTDCVKFDEKYRNIMEYLLGRVVVADNMDNAIRISKKAGGSLRFVTLEGEIINSGGAITGGRYRNNTANLLERRAEISRMKEKLTALSEEAEDCEKRRRETASHAEEIQDSIRKYEEKAREKEREHFALENDITLVRTALDDFESSSAKWDRELVNITQEQESSDRSVGDLRKEVEKLKSDIRETEARLESESADHEEEKNILSTLNEEITDMKIALGAAESEKNKADVIVSRIRTAMDEIEADIKRKKSEMARLEEEKNQMSDSSSSAAVLREKEKEKEQLNKDLERMTAERADINRATEELSSEREALSEKTLSFQSQKHEAEIKIARQETQLENHKEKLWDEFEVSYIQAMDFRKSDFIMAHAVKENRDIKNRLRELGEVNVGSIEEYGTVSERYDFLTAQREDIEKSVNELKKIISDMDRIIRARFKESFDKIVENFESVFREFFGGGTANITLDNEDDPLNAVIEITAQPPGKQLKNINLLSGGEKTMTAIALMFAVLKTKPTPCCILDEVEASLDDSNIDIFANYLRNFKDIQFTLITHQKATMEHADVMYGVTMPERGISKVYSLDMESAV